MDQSVPLDYLSTTPNKFL